MPNDKADEVKLLEDRLRLGMLASDVKVLDNLIASDLIFTNHFGQLLSKQDDLEMHRSGVLKLHAMEPSEQQIKVGGQVAVVSVRMKLAGVYDGAAFVGDLRYTRVWQA